MKLSAAHLVSILLLSFAAGSVFAGFYVPWSSETAVSPIPFSSQQTVFCPSLECTSLPVSALDTATRKIDVAMYSFTNEDFSDALIRAHSRGVVVRVIVEKQQAGSQYSQHRNLADAGIRVRIDSNPNYMHHKFAVIDDSVLINGSMNWSGNGVRENNENVSVIHSPELNTLFAGEFERVWNESDAFSSN